MAASSLSSFVSHVFFFAPPAMPITRAPDPARPEVLRDLARDRPRRARRARDDDGIARLDLRDVDHAEVGGQTRDPEQAERRLERNARRQLHRAERALAVGDAVLLPA